MKLGFLNLFACMFAWLVLVPIGRMAFGAERSWGG
jgi:hypothetical protein